MILINNKDIIMSDNIEEVVNALLKLSKKKVSFKKDIVHKKITFEVDRIKHYPHYSREKIKPLNKNLQLKLAKIELKRLQLLKKNK